MLRLFSRFFSHVLLSGALFLERISVSAFLFMFLCFRYFVFLSCGKKNVSRKQTIDREKVHKRSQVQKHNGESTPQNKSCL